MDKFINKYIFDMNTYVYSNTMLEGEEPNENSLLFKYNTNIKSINSLNYENSYCVTYITKEGYMYSKINLNKYEVIKLINKIKNEIEENMVNIFNMKEGILWKV